jgi:hypothetical protein
MGLVPQVYKNEGGAAAYEFPAMVFIQKHSMLTQHMGIPARCWIPDTVFAEPNLLVMATWRGLSF